MQTEKRTEQARAKPECLPTLKSKEKTKMKLGLLSVRIHRIVGCLILSLLKIMTFCVSSAQRDRHVGDHFFFNSPPPFFFQYNYYLLLMNSIFYFEMRYIHSQLTTFLFLFLIHSPHSTDQPESINNRKMLSILIEFQFEPL